MSKKRNPRVKIKAADLKIHPYAQRALSESRIAKMMAEFDLDGIGTIHVVHYAINGVLGYWVVDGQHRIVTLLRHGFGDWVCDCEVHDSVTDDAGASALFLVLNDRAPVSRFDKHANKVRAGVPAAVRIESIAHAHGLKVDHAGKNGNLACISIIEKVDAIDEGATFGRCLDIALGAFGHTIGAVEGQFLDGLAAVFVKNNGKVDDAALVKRLAKYPGGAAGLLGDAKGLRKLRHGRRLGLCVADAIVETYNVRRNGDTRLDAPDR